MDQRSVFFEEWLRSLREQYKHVVRQNDKVTLPTLSAVMGRVGFSEDELAQLRVEATIHVDDVDADFVPDLDALKGSAPKRAHAADHPLPQGVIGDGGPIDAEDRISTQDSDSAALESERAYPAGDEDKDMSSEETQPLTFEDSLKAEVDEIEDEPIASEDVMDADDGLVDGPEQMSLF